jgi:glycosyltransferase involved in cell wall biosynthesis
MKENAIKPPKISLITKPLNPPWNDSGKIVPRDLVSHSKTYRYQTLVTKGFGGHHSHADAVGIYRDSGRLSPTLVNQLHLLTYLLKPMHECSIFHFFFTPNRKSSLIGRIAMSLKSRVRTIQTITSMPAMTPHLAGYLFTDSIVALSEHTKALIEALTCREVNLIYPGVTEAPEFSDDYRLSCRTEYGTVNRLGFLYPGDLLYSQAAPVLQRSIPRIIRCYPDVKIFIACRTKTSSDNMVEMELRKTLAEYEEHMVFPGEVPDMTRLLLAVDTVVFPVKSMLGKMDIPLVLLEAMAMQIPVIVSDLPPLKELMKLDPGMVFPAGDHDAFTCCACEMLEKKDLRIKYGKQGEQSVREIFNAEMMANKYERLYDRELEMMKHG